MGVCIAFVGIWCDFGMAGGEIHGMVVVHFRDDKLHIISGSLSLPAARESRHFVPATDCQASFPNHPAANTACPQAQITLGRCLEYDGPHHMSLAFSASSGGEEGC